MPSMQRARRDLDIFGGFEEQSGAEGSLCTAAEMGNALPKEPFFFLKPTTSYLANGGTVELPKGIDVHYEGWSR